MLTGALAAAVTPLREEGQSLDEPAFAPLVEFLARGGLDGILAMGTTGEGMLLSVSERRRAAELFIATRSPGFAVAVHCGAQTTGDTVALCGHAAEAGADAVAVIGPPYFPLDAASMLAHFAAAARACAPLPFYVYEFEARSGYAVPVPVLQRLRDVAGNFAGLKVSDTPFEAVEPYLLDGLDVFIGSEPLALAGLERGAVGAVSALATAFPEIVADLVHSRSREAHRAVTAIREALRTLPFQSALKTIAAERGVPIRPDVRAPLRQVTGEERAEAMALLDQMGVAVRPPPSTTP
jgi:dihydrodipicolinate synthase/N-acetylneuraminate lyase